jgi:hypothetical protein
MKGEAFSTLRAPSPPSNPAGVLLGARSLGNPLRPGRSHSASRCEFASGDTLVIPIAALVGSKTSKLLKSLAGGLGFEPRLAESECTPSTFSIGSSVITALASGW